MQSDYAWIELSKSALENNVSQYKKVVGPKIIAPVIKANAYGHGILEISQLCQENEQVDWLCVAMLSEAVYLRKNGIKKPILVLSYLDEEYEQAVYNNVSIVAYEPELIKKLNNIGKKTKKIFNIHVKIDTGLCRLGILEHKALDLITYIKTLKFINLEGVWTHFSEPQLENREFTCNQLAIFESIIDVLNRKGIKIPFKHCSNSAGALTVETQLDNFIRPGAGFYGYWPSDFVTRFTQKKCSNFQLNPVLSLKSKIFSIKNIPKGSFVGYERTCQVFRDSKIGLLPIGYFDGYDRRLSNKGKVIIHGQYASVIGNIGMNLTSIDVTGLKDVENGDEVIVFGPYSGINASDIAELFNMNKREITTRLHPKIPRIIVP